MTAEAKLETAWFSDKHRGPMFLISFENDARNFASAKIFHKAERAVCQVVAVSRGRWQMRSKDQTYDTASPYVKDFLYACFCKYDTGDGQSGHL
jgi:hypothetical protein